MSTNETMKPPQGGGSALNDGLYIMDIKYCKNDDGRAYYAKGHVDIYVFQEELARLVDNDDPILEQEPEWCWMRVCRDFHAETTIIVEATPKSRGAFPATWVQDV